MSQTQTTSLPMVEENEAVGDVAKTYAEIRRDMQVPSIPNMFKTLAGSPTALVGTWEALRNVYLESTLPMSLKAMILYAIATASECEYCSAIHQVTCRTLGVEEETLEALANDRASLNPERVRKIISFAVQCVEAPLTLSESDYDQVRDQGVTDEELMEIIALAALGKYLDTLADSLKMKASSLIG